MIDNNAGLRSELTPIVNDAFKRASSAQQAALPDAAPFVEAIIGVVARYYAAPTVLSFDALRAANVRRNTDPRAHGGKCADWLPADWLTAIAGELGEAANLLKKRRRGADVPTEEIAKELADTVTYLDLLAHNLGIDLGAAVVGKFNEISERLGIYPDHSL